MTDRHPTAEEVRIWANELFEEVREIRRHLHAHPELSFEETATAQYISEKLTAHGISHTTGVSGTGIVAVIEGQGPGPTIALRGDMDALPITEQSEAPYRSTNEGVMHACGHDVHTANVIGAGILLHRCKDRWSGRVKLIFQPGEEKLPGGASLMIADGALESPSVDLIIGQHVFTDLPAGDVGFRPGMYMASADEIYLTVKGQGGHAAMPHKNIDPILMSAHLITALQQVVSRHAPPTTPSVLSFGRIEGLGATNVIPDEVHIAGTFRTLNEEWRSQAHQHIERLCHSLCESMGGSCDVDIRKGYPFLKNDTALTERCATAATDYLGAEHVHELPLRMTAEDFSYYSQVVPACFYRLGTTTTDGQKNSPVHTATFDIEEEALKTGVGLMAWLALSVGH